MSRKRRRYNHYDQGENNTTYVKAYSKHDFQRDERSFNQSVTEGKAINLKAFQRLMINDLCKNGKIIDTGCIGHVSIRDANRALLNPRGEWRILMEVSEELMHISPHYYRLNTMYSNMALFNWGIDIYDLRDGAKPDVIKKTYMALAARLENMSLKHEFSKIMRILPYQDIYCGLVIESASDFFFQRINYKVCDLYQIQDGLYNFRIDLSKISPKELGGYPDYVQQAYIDYRKGKTSSRWFLPPADKQICVKLNDQWPFPYPLLISLVQDILDLEVYKKLKLQSARTDNYKAIMVKVPIDESTIDKPLLTPDTLAIFAEMNRESMTDDIGLLYNLGSDGEAISFKDSTNTRNNVNDAVDELYNASGESRELFNGSSSGTAVTFSVENDSGFVYGLYRQFERWTNRYIKLKKYNKSTFKFHFYLLDITIFNRDNVSKRYREACTLGATVIDKWLATLDMTPSRMMGSYILHEDIFDFKSHFTPLNSSFNSADGNNAGGRPTNEESNKQLSEEGEKTKDGEKNDR